MPVTIKKMVNNRPAVLNVFLISVHLKLLVMLIDMKLNY